MFVRLVESRGRARTDSGGKTAVVVAAFVVAVVVARTAMAGCGLMDSGSLVVVVQGLGAAVWSMES